MTACQTGISLAFVLLALSWVGPVSAAELEITKPLFPAPTVKKSPGYTAAKRVPRSPQPTRLALQEDLRMLACSGSICMSPIFLGVGY